MARVSSDRHAAIEFNPRTPGCEVSRSIVQSHPARSGKHATCHTAIVNRFANHRFANHRVARRLRDDAVRVAAGRLPPAPVSYADQLLADAADAIDRLHLTTPPGDNAWERYLQILELEPDNEAAAVGLQRIVDRYLDLADDALTAGDSARASRFLGRAAQVLPGHAGIAHMRVRLASLEHARTNSIALDATGVREQHPAVSEQLLAIGTRAKQAGQRIVITARSDREGRWLYQRLNAAPGPRLRSELRIGRAPALTLQQLPR